MLYANYIIQQQNNNVGCEVAMGLESGGVASASIVPQLVTGQIYTTPEERERILITSACKVAPTLPAAPILTQITGANQSIIVVFTESYNGGSSLTNYQYSLDGGATFTSTNSIASPLIINGLTNGTSYSVILRAVNAVGVSPWSNSLTTTPVETIVQFTTVEATTWTAPTNIYTLEYLVVGGGGGSGGGFDTGAGAGGGGGMVLSGVLSIIPTTVYTVVVGDGGAAGTSQRSPVLEISGGTGQDSIFGSITALGGSGGWPSRQPAGAVNGNGGAAAVNPTTRATGGNGGGSNGGGGGGGGSSGAGGNKSGTTAGSGGAGTANSITGSSVTYGVGGNGGTGNNNNAGAAGTTNRGNGAKGGGAISGAQNNGAKGGSGIVVIKY